MVSTLVAVAAKGRVLVFDRQTCGCWGGGVDLGFGECYKKFPGGVEGLSHSRRRGNAGFWASCPGIFLSGNASRFAVTYPDLASQTVRIGPGYCATRESVVKSVMPSTVACATRILSNGSLWNGGRLSAATTCSLRMGNSP